MLMEFKQQQEQEAILLLMKDGTEDNSVDNNNRSSIQSLDTFDMESIDDVKLSHNNDTESIDAKSNINDNWSARSECTCETKYMDTITTSLDQHNTDNCEMNKVILYANKETHVLLKLSEESDKEKEMFKRTGNYMATVLFLYLRALLEDPDNHKEKPLTCNMEPDIHRAQQQNMQRELITRTKQMISET